MARIKNNITKSGASLINERTRFYREQSRPVRQPYIPNGYNTDNLNIDMAFNDENTINFDNLKYSSFKKYFNVYPNERSTISEQQATPSTFPDLGITFENFEGSDDFYNDQAELLEKFLKKVNPVEVKFSAFNDREYIKNTTTSNQNFIKGEGEYDFLDTNLYEETSIDIELEVPMNSLLSYSAKMQQFDTAPAQEFAFTDWADSPYEFRRNASSNVARTNSPFLIYNFEQNCFESRGWSKLINTNPITYEGNEIEIIPNLNFVMDQSVPKIISNSTYENFKTNLNFNLRNHNFALTNTPIQDLNTAKEPSLAQVGNYFSIPHLQFGFPHFPAFHTFNDNLLSMKKYLNKPFIVDRITAVLNVQLQSQVSTTQTNEDLFIGEGLNFSLNYHILNSPKNFKQIKPRLFISNPFQLKKDISQTVGNDTFNQQSDIILGKKPIISQSHASPELINPFFFASTQQNLPVKRKFFKDIIENDIISTSMAPEINFNTNIVSFGNVVFHAPNPDNLQTGKVYTQSHLTELTQLKNNNDLVIDTFDVNSFNKDMLPTDNIFLDYDGFINLNSYVKKSGQLSLDFGSNNINHQLEFFSNLNSTLQSHVDFIRNENNDIVDAKIFTNNTLNTTRNMINDKCDNKDLINSFSFLSFEEKNHGIIPTPIYRKTSNILFNNVFPGNQTNNNIYYQNKVERYVKSGFYKKSAQQFSPYVLTPNDNLAFCFSISPTITPKLFKHECYIKQGKVKFTLHGYMKKNNDKFQDYDNLKNLNQQNLSTTVIGDSIIIDDYNAAGYLDEYVNTFNDRIFEGTFELDTLNSDRKLNVTTPSKILSGKSYIPYLRLENVLSEIAFDSEDGFIYDDFRTYTIVFDKIFAKLNQIDNFNLYTAYEIAKELSFYKDKSPENDNIFNNIDLVRKGFKKYLNRFVKLRNYGQFRDNFEQRLYTSLMKSDVIDNIKYVAEQKFINDTTGEELTNLSNPLIPRNKSKYLQLIDAGFKSITSEGVITPWDGIDFYARKHVVYNDDLTPIFA